MCVVLDTESEAETEIQRQSVVVDISDAHAVYTAAQKRGVALKAVHQILRQHPGQWEIAVAERNVAAKMFWPKAIESALGISDLHLVEGDGDRWRGPIWRFRCA